MCEKCIKGHTRPDLTGLHPYTEKLLRIRMLQEAGYPFGVNDLEYEEWLDLGRLKQALAMPRL